MNVVGTESYSPEKFYQAVGGTVRPHDFISALIFLGAAPRTCAQLYQAAALEIGGSKLFGLEKDEGLSRTDSNKSSDPSTQLSFTIADEVPPFGMGVTPTNRVVINKELFQLCKPPEARIHPETLIRATLKMFIFPLAAYKSELASMPHLINLLHPADGESTIPDPELSMYHEGVAWVRVITNFRNALKDPAKETAYRDIFGYVSELLREKDQKLPNRGFEVIAEFIDEMLKAEVILPEKKLQMALNLVTNRFVYGDNALSPEDPRHIANLKEIVSATIKMPGGLLETTIQEFEARQSPTGPMTPKELATALARANSVAELGFTPGAHLATLTVYDWAKGLLNPSAKRLFSQLTLSEREDLVILIDESLTRFEELNSSDELMTLIFDLTITLQQKPNLSPRENSLLAIALPILQLPSVCDDASAFRVNLKRLPKLCRGIDAILEKKEELLELSDRDSILRLLIECAPLSDDSSTSPLGFKPRGEQKDRDMVRALAQRLSHGTPETGDLDIKDLALALSFYHGKEHPKPEQELILDRPKSLGDWWRFIFYGGHMGRFTHLNSDLPLLTDLGALVECGLPIHEIGHIHTAKSLELDWQHLSPWEHWAKKDEESHPWMTTHESTKLRDLSVLSSPSAIVFLPDPDIHAVILAEILEGYVKGGTWREFLSLRFDEGNYFVLESDNWVPVSHLDELNCKEVLDAQNRFWARVENLQKTNPGLMHTYPSLDQAITNALNFRNTSK